METKKCTKLRFFALGVAFWCFCLVALAQSVNVKGTVVDSHGESIIGASVVQKGNPSVGTVSDLEGNFQLKITGKNPVIVVSYVGMRATEVKVVSGKPVNSGCGLWPAEEGFFGWFYHPDIRKGARAYRWCV